MSFADLYFCLLFFILVSFVCFQGFMSKLNKYFMFMVVFVFVFVLL